MKEILTMINQQVSPINYIKRVNMIREDKTLVAKVSVKNPANIDLTQTKDFYSIFAVLS